MMRPLRRCAPPQKQPLHLKSEIKIIRKTQKATKIVRRKTLKNLCQVTLRPLRCAPPSKQPLMLKSEISNRKINLGWMSLIWLGCGVPWDHIPQTDLLIVNLKVDCFIFLLYCFSWVAFIRKDDHAKCIIFWKVETARVIIFEKMTEWKWLSRAKGWKGAAQPEASHLISVVPPKNIASWFWFRIQ